MQQGQKPYGLIRLSKGTAKSTSATSLATKPSVFGESDSDSDSASVPQFHASNARKQAQAKISKAFEEDPNIFQYDEVYDQMKSASIDKQKQNTKNVERKSRYIGTMLKTKDLREKEQELRAERKIQKERELEGEEFKEKEAFVTSAYKEKLEELKKTREDMEKQESIENILDVTKQTDLNGFYRSMFRNDLFNQETSEEQNDTVQSVKFNKKSSNQKKVNLRERNLSDDENEENENDAHIDDVTAADEVRNEPTDKALTEKEDRREGPAKRTTSVDEPAKGKPVEQAETKQVTSDLPDGDSTETPVVVSCEVVEQEVLPAKKPKIDRAELIRKMFTKRTVDKALEEARNRYLERKALRQL